MKLKVKIDMHIEQCNVVVSIKYEIKILKIVEDTISLSWLVLATIPDRNLKIGYAGGDISVSDFLFSFMIQTI